MSDRLAFPSGKYDNHDVAVLVFNHGGSLASQDTGRDIRYIAERLRVPTFAFDRPGSGYTPASLKTQSYLGDNYPEAIQKFDGPVEAMCAINGFRRLIVAGRSGGGAAAAVFAVASRMRRVSIAGVYTAEMAGCGMAGGNSAPERAHARHGYRDYLKRQRDQQKINDRLIVPHEPKLRGFAAIGRYASMGIANLNDFFNNDKVWGSWVAIEAAQQLAANRPDAHLRFEFAKDSAVATQQTIDDLAGSLRNAWPAGSTGSLAIYQPPHTTHASFDNRRFFADHLGLVVDPVIYG